MTGLFVATVFGSALLSAFLTSLAIRFAQRKQFFMPELRWRDSHRMPTPRVGGIAIVTTFIVGVLLLSWFFPSSLQFGGETWLGIDQNLFGVLLAILALSAVNIYDDYRGVSWYLRLATQIAAGITIFICGINIEWLTNPFGGQILLEGLAWLFVVVWVVGLSNAVNMLDGVDGLASGVAAVALVVLAFLSIRPDVAQPSNALLAFCALGAVIGFLPFNLVNARAFLGDTGSVFLGFIIAVISIISGGKVATAFLVLAIPVFDALFVVINRIITGRSPFKADRLHLHHKLLEVGLRPLQITGLLVSISAVFGLIALNTQALGKLQAAAWALALIIVFLLAYRIIQHTRQHTRRAKNGILEQ